MTKTVILAGERQREYAYKLLAQAALGEVVTIAPPKKSREQ